MNIGFVLITSIERVFIMILLKFVKIHICKTQMALILNTTKYYPRTNETDY